MDVEYGKSRMVLNEAQELEPSQYILESSRMYFGFSRMNIRKLSYQCATAANIGKPDSWLSEKSAERDCFFSFMNRHPVLVIRKLEATNLFRATSFNKSNVGCFFDKLAEVIDRLKLKSSAIWNVDETGITTVQNPKNIVAARGILPLLKWAITRYRRLCRRQLVDSL